MGVDLRAASQRTIKIFYFRLELSIVIETTRLGFDATDVVVIPLTTPFCAASFRNVN